jgi:eukaryotic-like serine/threonine-protein kinase
VASADGRNVLVDVGIARHLTLTDLTGVGGWAGTPGFMSPEQAVGRRSLTIHSDTFSLGVTLFQLAARRHPFNNAQHFIGRMPPPPLRSARPDLAPTFVNLIHAMMEVRPTRRPNQVAQLMASFM